MASERIKKGPGERSLSLAPMGTIWNTHSLPCFSPFCNVHLRLWPWRQEASTFQPLTDKEQTP